MISKRVKLFQRWVYSGKYKISNAPQHSEKVLRNTWYLFWIFPIYSSEVIIENTMR